MDQTVSLSGQDCLSLASSITCEVCRTSPAVFSYDIFDEGKKGHCCPSCFLNLIRAMSDSKTG
jgi:hypothetical protein